MCALHVGTYLCICRQSGTSARLVVVPVRVAFYLPGSRTRKVGEADYHPETRSQMLAMTGQMMMLSSCHRTAQQRSDGLVLFPNLGDNVRRSFALLLGFFLSYVSNLKGRSHVHMYLRLHQFRISFPF